MEIKTSPELGIKTKDSLNPMRKEPRPQVPGFETNEKFDHALMAQEQAVKASETQKQFKVEGTTISFLA